MSDRERGPLQFRTSTWNTVSGPDHALNRHIMLGTILIVVLFLMLLGALPTWPHSRSWGYYPTGGLGLLLTIVVILLLLGRI